MDKKRPSKREMGKTFRTKKTTSGSRRRKTVIPEPVDEAPKKKLVMLPDHSMMDIRVLSPEHKELKREVDEKVKSPPPYLKRRATLQNVKLVVPPEKLEKENVEERQRLFETVEQ